MSTAKSGYTAVPVDLLRTGVYVVELDRPWVETPFLFQGFRIESEQELQMLRKHCRFVYADLGRSERSAVDRMRADAERRRAVRRTQTGDGETETETEAEPEAQRPSLARPSEEARRKGAGALVEAVAHPDRARFTTMVQQAHAVRTDAHTAIDRTFRQASQDGGIDAAMARAAAEEMAATVLEDPAASLWLTHLRDRDAYLATHSINVCILALSVGAHLGFSQGSLRQLGLGALLHCVGRVKVPQEILDKPGPLEQHELDLVRRYPEDGFTLVSESGGVPELARQVIRCHQERWAGHGYPRGLFGESVPVMALIAGIADAYDAMTSDRPYRAAMSPEEALHVLYENAEREFGTDIVQAFMRVLGAFPVGSVIELDNGAVGMVVGLRPGAGLWPTVLLLQTPDGTPYQKRLLLNLAASDRAKGDMHNRRIRRARRPADVGIDTGAIVAREFGLDAVA